MNKIIVNVLNHIDNVPNLDEAMAEEMKTVTDWKQQGWLEQLYIKNDRTGAILVFTGIDEDRVKSLLASLPMSKSFEQMDFYDVTATY